MLISISFPNIINVSVQPNPDALYTNVQGADVAYYVQTNPATLPQATSVGNIVEIGPVVATTDNSIICDVNPNYNIADIAGKFILFTKNAKANMSSLLGYYAKFRFENSSGEDAELFSIGSELFESSK